jgi:hypothetical protein
MKQRMWFLASVMGAVLTATSSFAAGVFYDCDITNRRDKVDWISPKVAVIVQANGAVQVIDSVLINFRQAPATARVTRNTEKVLKARWSVRDARDSSGQEVPDFGYDLRLNKTNNTIVIGATPHGFAGHFSGRGTCTLRKK